MKKAILSLALVLLMVVSLISGVASSADTTIYDVGTTISDVGINLGGTTLSGNAEYSVRTNIAGMHIITLECGGNNMIAGSKITLTVDGAAEVIDLAKIPVITDGNPGSVTIEKALDPGVHTISIAAVLVPGVGGLESLIVKSLTVGEYMAVAAPAFSLPEGSYPRTTQLSLTMPVEWKNASIRYTTDGSTPSATVGNEYAGIFNIFPTGTEVGGIVTIKAIAYQSGKTSSAVVTQAFTAAADSATLADVTCNRAAGALTNSTMTGITLTHAVTSAGGAIWYTVDGSDPAPNNPAAKKYVSGIKILEAGTLKAKAFDVNNNSSALLERAYTVTSSVPTFLHLPAGTTTVGKGSAIQITTATNVSPNTKIWFTTDGSDPVPANAGDGKTFLFEGPIPVPNLAHNATFEVRAIAGGEGLSTTAVTSQSYTFDANTTRLTWIKDDPDFIKWKNNGFINGEEPASLITLIDKIYDELPKTGTAATTNGSGIFAFFKGGGQTAAQGVPGSAWGASGLRPQGIPDHFSYDGPAGARLTAESAAAYERDVTYWPNGSARASAWNKALSEQMGEGWGKELKYFSLNVILAPGINVHRSVLNGRNFEYYSEEPMLAGLTAASEIKGVQKDGKAGVALKHFAMNQQERNRTNGITRASTRTIREIYLRAFQYAVEDAKPWSLMTAFNDINGIHCAQNYDLNTVLLRNEWGFKGLVMTDYNGYGTTGNGSATGPNNTYPYYSQGLAPNNHAGTLKSGVQLLLATATATNLQSAYNSGYITEDELKTAFRTLCTYVSKYNTFNCDPWHYYADPAIKEGNRAISLQLAEESAVLIKNNIVSGNAALPLNKAANGKILSLGMSADRLYRGGTGSGSINMTAEAAARLLQLPEALRNVVGYDKVLNTANTVEFPRTNGLSQVASITASGAMSSTGARQDLSFTDERFQEFYSENLSAILFVLQRESGENADINVQKGAYYLSDAEQRLIDQGSALAKAKGIPFVVIINTGSWTEFESWKDKADAIIQCWNTGQAAATPMVNLLFGDANPSGKLPTTVPIDVVGKDANGNYYNPSEGEFSLSNSNWNGVTYREGIFVGYRYFDSFNVPVSYPFGHGLSYTTFDFSNAALSKATFDSATDEITASVKIANTGSRAGKEVAQFYIGAPGFTMVKPVKELKGYDKTKELAPGESQTLSVKFNAMSLASYDEQRGLWVIEPGTYNVYFSNSSAVSGIQETLTIKVAKEIVAAVVDKDAMAPNTNVTASGGRDGTASATFYEYSPSGLNLDVKVYRNRSANGRAAQKYVYTVVNKSKSGNVGDVGKLILAEYDSKDRFLGFSNAGLSLQDLTLTETTSAAASRNFLNNDFRLVPDPFSPGTARVRAFLWTPDTFIPMNNGSFIDID